MMFKRTILILAILFSQIDNFSQVSTPFASGDILQQLERLNTLGSALYIAAHPDDENTQLISFLVNGMHLRTGYLAATRGDGGQNLIGPEIREKLGIIRTQELLAARRTDGGEQFFSRANDFGYSKDPAETFNVWNREEVLADFVWTIRKFRPDVLITRFNIQPGVTHGHHTASAILAKEAFTLSGDSTAFPEQLKYVDVWQPSKILWNTSQWFFSRSGQDFDEEKYIKLNVGGYNPYVGKSYTEISAKSRSMHKSQGFGATGSRGENYEYFEYWGGEETKDLFGGINTTWARVEGAEQVSYFLKEALLNYDPAIPHAILPELLNARKELLKIRDQYWKEVKLLEIEETILSITGTYIELSADDYLYTQGDSIQISLEVINRSPADIQLTGVNYSISNNQVKYNLDLKENQSVRYNSSFTVPSELKISHPYWLERPGSEGMYVVDNQLLRGLPENPPVMSGLVSLKIEDQFVDVETPVIYKYNDPVDGESFRPVEIAPEVMVSLETASLIFGDQRAKEVRVRVTAAKPNQKGSVSLRLPKGWEFQPKSSSFSLNNKGEEQLVIFNLTPPTGSSTVTITAVAQLEGNSFSRGKSVIDYDHIPTQTLFPEANAKAVKLDLRKENSRIGYIMGAGDDLPSLLEGIGYEVTLLEKDQVEKNNLRQYDAVILGIRAFNTIPWLAYKNQDLFDYVEAGGNLIVQYNTNRQLVTEEIAPYSLKISRDRVTVEQAPVKLIAPKHEVLNKPNIITQKDFDGWVQERGLYFPNEWADEFIPILSMNDPVEETSTGSLLVARYGKGFYCYTGLSFFRELPAGVPGAYRLLVNLISFGENNQPK